MAGTAIVAVRRLSRPAAGPLGAGHPVVEQEGVVRPRPAGLARAAGGTRPAGRSQMGGRSSPHLSSRSGPSSSSTPGSENTGAPSGTGIRSGPAAPASAGSDQPASAGSGQPASAGSRQSASVGRVGPVGVGRSEAGLVCRAAACVAVRRGDGGAGAGTGLREAGRWYCRCGAAGRCSHWMPASLQSWWDRCHGEDPAVSGVAGPGVAGDAERLGWNPGPPARPCSAWVAPSARGAGFGVSGEDQDPSGSRRGEGTGLAARQGLASGLGLAGPVGAGSRGSGPAGASPPASWAAGTLGAGALGAGALGAGALGAGGRRRLRCAQEPSCGRRHAGPGIVVSG